MKISSRGFQSFDTNGRGRAERHPTAEFTSFDELLTFDQEVAAIEPELRRFVARKVRAEAVDDVLQEVWLAAWQALPNYDRRAKFRTWIYGICVHKCHDHYRTQRSEPCFMPLDEMVVDGRPSLENSVVQTDTVNRLLAELDQNHREVLELYYYAQLTLAEIASVLDRNLNTVKYQFYRAHSQLLTAGGRDGLL